MKNSALVVIDLQNDITKNYREIIERVNEAIDWAVREGLWVVYIQHNNLSAGTRTFKPGTRGAELVPELKLACVRSYLHKVKKQRPDQRALRRIHPRARHHGVLPRRRGRRSLRQIHRLQPIEKRLHRPRALRLHHELRQKKASGAARLLQKQGLRGR